MGNVWGSSIHTFSWDMVEVESFVVEQKRRIMKSIQQDWGEDHLYLGSVHCYWLLNAGYRQLDNMKFFA